MSIYLMSTLYKENLIFINNLNKNSIFKINRNKFILDDSYLSWMYSSNTNNIKDITELIKKSFTHYLIVLNIDSSNSSILNLLEESLEGINNLQHNKNMLDTDKEEIKNLHTLLNKMLEDNKTPDNDKLPRDNSKKSKNPNFVRNIINNIVNIYFIVYNYFSRLF